MNQRAAAEAGEAASPDAVLKIILSVCGEGK